MFSSSRVNISIDCRYQLLLRDLVRHTEKGLDILGRNSSDESTSLASNDQLRASLQDEVETLSRALHIMTVVPKMANDMMMVGRLQGFDVNTTFVWLDLLLNSTDCQRHQLAIRLNGSKPQLPLNYNQIRLD